MLNPTAADLELRRNALEHGAALTLGRMLFAFSRLDMNLGLMLSWALRDTSNGSQLKNLDDVNFNSRLEFLGRHIESSTNLPIKAKAELSSWLGIAHSLRTQRNQLVHGRWGIDAVKDKVLNIVGLPSSNNQHTIEYSLAELEAHNHRIEQFTSTLSELRERWQLA
jgi:hypothetical protein